MRIRVQALTLCTFLSSIPMGSAFLSSQTTNHHNVHGIDNFQRLSASSAENAMSNFDSEVQQGEEGLTTFTPGQATQRLGSNTGPTVWTEFGRIAQKFDPVNLGQGFPDWLPPKFAVESLVEAVQDSAQSPHQYTRPAGHPNLVKQLAHRYSIHMRQDIDPMNEVAVTVGASQALYLSLQTLINPGASVFLVSSV